MQIMGDYHTHSEYSHGQGDLKANIEAALASGLKEIAITDHGPKTWNFIRLGIKRAEELLEIKNKIDDLQKVYSGIKIYTGVEANIINAEGELDIPLEILDQLDLVAAGFHLLIWPPDLKSAQKLIFDNRFIYKFFKSKREEIRQHNTEIAINAVRRNNINFITHPGYKLDIDTYELARVCEEEDTWLEINARHGQSSEDFVKAAATTEVKFIVNSDAHSPEEVGKLDPGLKITAYLGLSEARIINYRGLKNILHC